MNIGKEIVQELLEQSTSIVALYPGKFKPPHSGHFDVVKQASRIADEVLIIMSNIPKDEFTAEQSMKVWALYEDVLPTNVEVKISSKSSPVSEVFDVVKDKTRDFIVLYGKGERSRYASIERDREKYSNVQIVDAGNFEGLNATELRNAIRNKDLEDIQKFLPQGIDSKKVLSIYTQGEFKPGPMVHESVIPQEKFAQETNQDWVQKALNNLPGKDQYDLKNYTVEILPLDKVKPTQFGEDYINASSEYEAEQYKKYLNGEIGVEDLRREDFYPIIVDKDIMGIIDGNHRHAVHKILNIPNIKVILVSKKHSPSYLSEMAKSDLDNVERYAEKELNPLDVEFSRHFFDRINDPRNNKEISTAELIGFFKRLSRNKNKFVDFLKKYHEIVVKDPNTNINIPFVDQVNQVIAKTVMRKPNFSTSNPTITLESKILSEEIITNNQSYITLLNQLAKECCQELNIEVPKIYIINNSKYTEQHKSYAGYYPEEKKIKLVIYGRLLKDSMVSLCHELKHHHQNINGYLKPNSGEDGDEWENDANSYAGKFMRQFGRNHPEIYFIRYD